VAKYLSRVFDYLNRLLASHSQSKTVPRNLVYIRDRFLTGSARFARKYSNDVGILVPHNVVETAERIQAFELAFELDEDLPSLTAGDIVVVNNRERFYVASFDHSSLEGTFTTQSGVEHVAGSPFTHHATPVTFTGLSGPVPAWDVNTSITIESPYPIYAGDVLCLPDPNDGTNPYALSEVKVLSQTTTGPVLGLYTINAELDLIYRDWRDRLYETGQTLYLRCYPAYKSPPVVLPTWYNGEHIGPCVLDWMSGDLTDTVVSDTQFNVDVLDPIFSVIRSETDVGKNYVVWDAPIHNSIPVFWRSWRADVNYRQGYTVVRSQGDGHAQLSTELVPEMRPGSNWQLNIKTFSDTVFRYKFHPNAWVETTIPAGSDAYVPIGIGAGEDPSPRLQLSFDMADDVGEVWLGAWRETVQTVALVQYEIVAKVLGGFSWASTGLLVKPFFKNALQLHTRLNAGHRLNSGYFLGG